MKQTGESDNVGSYRTYSLNTLTKKTLNLSARFEDDPAKRINLIFRICDLSGRAWRFASYNVLNIPCDIASPVRSKKGGREDELAG